MGIDKAEVTVMLETVRMMASPERRKALTPSLRRVEELADRVDRVMSDQRWVDGLLYVNGLADTMGALKDDVTPVDVSAVRVWAIVGLALVLNEAADEVDPVTDERFTEGAKLGHAMFDRIMASVKNADTLPDESEAAISKLAEDAEGIVQSLDAIGNALCDACPVGPEERAERGCPPKREPEEASDGDA